MYKLGFIGLGNMASAIQTGFIASGAVKPEEICGFDLADPAKEAAKERGVAVLENGNEVVKQSEYVFMAVKPQVVEQVVAPLKEDLKNKALVSMVLRYDFEKYNTMLDGSTRHLTFMPNSPIAVGEGMTLFEEKQSLTDEEYAYIKSLFEASGSVQVMPSHLMDAAGILTGCGPAYIYLVIEALADGAVYEGIPREAAYKLASQTVLGSGKMQLVTGKHPGFLKDTVTSPGGTTIKGVKALEDAGVRAAFMESILKPSGD
jgi:pyrroline-5-carboxylate reductase